MQHNPWQRCWGFDNAHLYPHVHKVTKDFAETWVTPNYYTSWNPFPRITALISILATALKPLENISLGFPIKSDLSAAKTIFKREKESS